MTGASLMMTQKNVHVGLTLIYPGSSYSPTLSVTSGLSLIFGWNVAGTADLCLGVLGEMLSLPWRGMVEVATSPHPIFFSILIVWNRSY